MLVGSVRTTKRKRTSGRDAVAAIASRFAGVGRVSTIVVCVLRTSLHGLVGGGEPAIAEKISTFLVGFECVLRHVVAQHLLNVTTLRHLLTFAYNPTRLRVKSSPKRRLLSVTVLPAQTNCVCDSLTKQQLEQNVLRRLNHFNTPVIGDTVTIAERVLTEFLRSKTNKFETRDAMVAARPCLPPPSMWVGARFQLRENTSSETFTIYTIIETRLTRGRVTRIRCSDASNVTFWGTVRGFRDNWAIRFKYHGAMQSMSDVKHRVHLFQNETFSIPQLGNIFFSFFFNF